MILRVQSSWLLSSKRIREQHNNVLFVLLCVSFVWSCYLNYHSVCRHPCAVTPIARPVSLHQFIIIISFCFFFSLIAGMGVNTMRNYKKPKFTCRCSFHGNAASFKGMELLLGRVQIVPHLVETGPCASKHPVLLLLLLLLLEPFPIQTRPLARIGGHAYSNRAQRVCSEARTIVWDRRRNWKMWRLIWPILTDASRLAAAEPVGLMCLVQCLGADVTVSVRLAVGTDLGRRAIPVRGRPVCHGRGSSYLTVHIIRTLGYMSYTKIHPAMNEAVFVGLSCLLQTEMTEFAVVPKNGVLDYFD